MPSDRSAAAKGDPAEPLYSLTEVAFHLQVAPESLRGWKRRFGVLLSPAATTDEPRFSQTDVAALTLMQRFIEQGLPDEQIIERFTPKRLAPEPAISTALTQEESRALVDGKAALLPQALGDLLSSIANSQGTVREMVGVVVQDNFNLKEENRKLRDRMLELERALAEYQRREETRKDRMESRLRALEGTLAAMQQQMAQLIQVARQAPQKKRGWW
jgi:DNA-binding transcriptional MerR regulator